MSEFMNATKDRTPPDAVVKSGTIAVGAFIEETNHIWRLVAGVYSSVLNNVKNDKEVLADDLNEDFYQKLDKHSVSNDLTNKIVTELIICRIVDNFQCYISQLLEFVFRNKKETLLAATGDGKSPKTVEIDLKTLFSFNTMDELFNYLVEKKISSLSYKSIDEFSSFFSDKLGFSLFNDNIEKSVLNKAIQARNIIVHNRAIIDRQFISKAGGTDAEIGAQLHLNASDIIRMHLFIANVAKSTDIRAVDKFKLPTIEFKANKGIQADAADARRSAGEKAWCTNSTAKNMKKHLLTKMNGE
ncbi:MAG: hypothetical protein HY881_27635 [Deltaproteobacteria bacterium]|nr:hypothetical protein [Deltaproteobacteria bacterium]